MKNIEIVKMLEHISELVETEQPFQAVEYIKQQISQLKNEEDPTSDYIDDLVDNLK